MPSVTLEEKVNRFICDENYLALVESTREHRLLFITDLSETRVSALLAWLLRPNEGHGLGDHAFRQLLKNAWLAVNSGDWDGPTWNKLGLKGWEPMALATKSFSDLCIETEYSFGKAKKDGKGGRPVDLFLVSRSNKLVVLVENKFGTGAHSGQLKAYREQADASFDGYTKLLIYLDPNAEHRPDDGEYWVTLRYEWLIELIATQEGAGLLSSRALDALSQLRVYLETTDGDSKYDERIGSLVNDHAEVLKELREIGSIKTHDRFTEGPSSVVRELLLVEYQQRLNLWRMVLRQMEHLPLVLALKGLDIDDLEIRQAPKYIRIRKRPWSAICEENVPAEKAWGIRVEIWRPDADHYAMRSLIGFYDVQLADGSVVSRYSEEQEEALREVADQLRQMKRKASTTDRWVRLREHVDRSMSEIVKRVGIAVSELDNSLLQHQLIK